MSIGTLKAHEDANAAARGWRAKQTSRWAAVDVPQSARERPRT
jgi:hypothetical protein